MQILVSIAIAAVAVILVLGLANMLKNGPAGRSQSLMRWRVGLQAVAVVAICVAIYFGN